MNSQKPLCILDIEATGLNPATDRIVSLAISKDGEMKVFYCNPGVLMADDVVAIHGITNEQAATFMPFKDQAEYTHEFIKGCDLAGFNLLNYDVPMLWEEFYRCGIEWDLRSVRIVDVGNIFKKKEERTLSAAVQFYLNREHTTAHTASGDVEATAEVMRAQLQKYPDLNAMNLAELADYSAFDNRIDLAGKFVLINGIPCYNIGKVRGTPVEDDTSFANWMLGKDFSANTKQVARQLLDEIYERDRLHAEMEREQRADEEQDDDVPF